MSDDIVQINRDCVCGHDRQSHYWDKKGSGDCLCPHCTCVRYRDRHAPPPTIPPPPRAAMDTQDVFDDGEDTEVDIEWVDMDALLASP